LARGEFNKDLLVLGAKDLDFGDVRNMQQPRADILGIVAQLAMGEPLRREAVDQPVGIAEVIVKTRPDNASRKRVTDVANAFANPIPDVRNVGRSR
jgi:hypothetical protein